MESEASDMHVTLSCDNKRTVALSDNTTSEVAANSDVIDLDVGESTIVSADSETSNVVSTTNTDFTDKCEDTDRTTAAGSHDKIMETPEAPLEDDKLLVHDTTELQRPKDKPGDVFKSALMEKSKNISATDKEKIISMVKGLSKYQDAEEDLQVTFTNTGKTNKQGKKGKTLDCEIEESLKTIKAYTPLDSDSNKTDPVPQNKQVKPNEEEIVIDITPVTKKKNSPPKHKKNTGADSVTPTNVDKNASSSKGQIVSTENNVVFEFGKSDNQSPTPSAKKGKKRTPKKASVADALQEIVVQTGSPSGKGKEKAQKQSAEHLTVNRDLLDNLSDVDYQLSGQSSLGFTALMGGPEPGKNSKKAKRQQESAAASSGSYSQLLQSMGGAKPRSSPAHPGSSPVHPGSSAAHPGSPGVTQVKGRAKPSQAEQLRESLKSSPRPISSEIVNPAEPVVKQKAGKAKTPPTIHAVAPPIVVQQTESGEGGKKKKNKKKKDVPIQPGKQPQQPQQQPPPPFNPPVGGQEVRLAVRKEQHKYIVGPQRLHLQEIYNITGVTIEVPSFKSESEEIVLRGDPQQVGAALALMFSKSQLAQAQEVARPKDMSQPAFVQGQGAASSRGQYKDLAQFSLDEELAAMNMNENANRHGAYSKGQEYKREYRRDRGQTPEQGQGYQSQGQHPQGHQSQGQHPQGYQSQGQHPQGYQSQGQHPQGYQSQGQHPQGYQSQGQHPQGYQSYKGPTGRQDKQQQQRSTKGQGQYGVYEGRQTPQRPEGQGQGHGSAEKSQGKKQRQRKKDCKKPVFEEYIPMEEVSHGLKRGTLVQGPIRINPKNFMEAYVPHPDGASDIVILGTGNRNRALNGDIVAVCIEDQADWKLNKEELQQLEEEQSIIAAGGLSENATREPKVTDSDPEVIIESEEIVELVEKASTDGAKSEPGTTEGTSDIVTPGENSSSVKKVEKGISDLSIEPKTTESTEKQRTKENVEGAKGKISKSPNTDKKGKQTPYKRPDRFTSLREVMADGSPVAKSLFSNQGNQEAGSQSEEAKKLLQRSGKVVAIIEQKHSRASAGHIRPFQDKNPNIALFAPNDHRNPRLMVPIDDCPKDFLERPEDHEKTLYIARLTEWKVDSQFAHGRLARSLGEAGEIEPETEAHLIENGVDFDEFPQEALDCLPKDLPWTIPAAEIEKRRDFREACVFTIDPATARDLDDALSCETLGDGKYKVGVHIADVSYFLAENTVLDKVAALRATSVYLVHKVIPMLPRLLCERLCSLNPDEDRLTFSVEWTIDENGEIEEEWFGRSVIRSCVKFSYDHAQGFIEQPDREWTREELPPISAPFTVDDIKSRVLVLDKIAKNLRRGRFDGGALRLDQVKLQYTLNGETGLPNGYWVYQQQDSNRLIEEFMLLANMAVAHRINDHYPDKALLRRHPPPQEKMVENLKDFCSSLGIHIDISTAGGINRSLLRYCGDDEYSLGRMQVLVSLCSKPMQNAKYFCNGCIDDESLYRHYALNVPLYTHFTSPIRRYADVLVHRVLAASLDYGEEPARTPQEIHRQAEHCNDKKTAAKRVGDLSSELFFAVFIKTAGPLEEAGMVMSVMDKAFDVFVLKLGVSKRVYCDKLPLKEKVFKRERKVPSLTLTWEAVDDLPEVDQEIQIFTVVDCVLQPGELPLQWMAVIKRPQPRTLLQVVPSEDE